MSTMENENLDERIERIRKRTEEIEKKHREAEEDRLMALKDNAMVETKPPKDENWPKAHKYDKLDFTYDVKPEKLDDNKEIDENKLQLNKPKRKFADGEGPPPDPAYNFLADAERDGNLLQQQQINEKIDKKDLRQHLNNNKNNIDIKYKEQYNKRNGQQNNNNFRGRNNSSTTTNTSGNNSGKLQQNNRYQKQNSQPEYEQWRSEKIDDNNKFNTRQNKNIFGGTNGEKWRRNDWDNNELKLDIDNKSPKHFNGNKNNYHQQKTTNNQNVQQQSGIFESVDDIIEKRGNIMISVSPGEVKSVKLTSAQVIGSGRVGPRQVSKPQFHIQSMEKEMLQQKINQNINVSNPSHSQHKTNFNQQQNIQPSKSNNVKNQHQNIYQQKNNKNSATPTQRPAQSNNQSQFISNKVSDVVFVGPKSPIKEKIINPKYKQQQQAEETLKKVNSISGANNTQNLTNPLNNIANNLLTSNTKTSTIGTDAETLSANSKPKEIDLNVLAVAKELSNKPEFVKKSVQDRLLRIRQTSQPDCILKATEQVVEKNNFQINNNEHDASNQGIETMDAIVSCN